MQSLMLCRSEEVTAVPLQMVCNKCIHINLPGDVEDEQLYIAEVPNQQERDL